MSAIRTHGPQVHDRDDEPAVLSSTDALRQLVENAGVGLYETAPDGRLIYANRTVAEMLGYASVAELLAEEPQTRHFYVDPEDQQRVRDAVEHDGAVRGMVFRARRRDRSLFWVSEHSTAVKARDGSITGYVGSVSDVTDLVTARQKLAEAERSYRRIFERATEGIYRSTLDGQQLRANPALTRMNGYASEEEQLGAVKDIATEWYVDPERRAAFKSLLERDGHVENFESEIYRHRTRERIWVSENAYLVRDDDGAPIYYEGTVRDVTEQKSAELALRRALAEAETANRAKTRFLAHMSHELRTPLNAILGFSDMLRLLGAGRLSPDRIREYADDIHRSGSHLLDLINDVLDLSRIESDAVPIRLEPVPAHELIEAALATVRPLANPKQIGFEVFADEALTASVDRRAMHQCLLNVLSNAVKFSPPGGLIRVEAAPADAMVRFAVHDGGPGIPPEVLARIGEPFNTATAPDQAAGTGTGLGLAITRSLVIRLGGSFEVQSAPGAGTCVTLRVPVLTG